MPYFFEVTNQDGDVLKIEVSPDGGILHGSVRPAKPVPLSREEARQAEVLHAERSAEKAAANARELEQISDPELRQRAIGFRFTDGNGAPHWQRWNGTHWVFYGHQPPPELGGR